MTLNSIDNHYPFYDASPSSLDRRSTLRLVLSRVLSTPNDARTNLDNVIALIDDTRTAEKATKLAAEFIEYIDSMCASGAFLCALSLVSRGDGA